MDRGAETFCGIENFLGILTNEQLRLVDLCFQQQQFAPCPFWIPWQKLRWIDPVFLKVHLLSLNLLD